MEQQKEQTDNGTSKSNMNDMVITVALVVIALCLFVQTIMKLSGGSEGQVAGNTLQQPTGQQPAHQHNANAAQIQVPQPEYDFGTVKKGEKPQYTFKITNTGSNPLQLSNANADEGIRVVSWSTQPIPQQQSAEIVVELNTDVVDGQVTKTVHVNTNANPTHQHFVVKANVVK